MTEYPNAKAMTDTMNEFIEGFTKGFAKTMEGVKPKPPAIKIEMTIRFVPDDRKVAA
jgi:hypothetical protein